MHTVYILVYPAPSLTDINVRKLIERKDVVLGPQSM